jgi:hypothetical protein
MAKSRLTESHSLQAEGFLDIKEDGTISIEIEDVGKKELSDLLIKFNGESIKFRITLKEDLT